MKIVRYIIIIVGILGCLTAYMGFRSDLTLTRVNYAPSLERVMILQNAPTMECQYYYASYLVQHIKKNHYLSVSHRVVMTKVAYGILSKIHDVAPGYREIDYLYKQISELKNEHIR